MPVRRSSEITLIDFAPGIKRVVAIDSAQGAQQFSFGLVEIAPEADLPLHRHRVEEGYYVLEGAGSLITDEGELQVRAGDAAFTPAGRWHTFRTAPGSHLRLVFAYAGTDVTAERRSPA